MIEVNLLRWREQRKRQANIHFLISLVSTVLLTLLLLLLACCYERKLIKHQVLRTKLLKQEISLLNHQIKKINLLKRKRKSLIQQIATINHLQFARTFLPHFLEELAQVIPQGVYLTVVREKKEWFSISGFAQTHDHLVDMIKRIEKNSWLHHPLLKEIKKNERKRSKIKSQFQLLVTLKPGSTDLFHEYN